MKNKKNIILSIVAAIIAIAAIISVAAPKLTKESAENSSVTKQQSTVKNEASSVQTITDDVVIDESTISETASFYDYNASGITVEVFAVKASDNTIRIALNTCQVCYGSPYAYFVQQGDSFVCQNCNNSFSRDDIGIAHGGCNPVPVTENDYKIKDGKMIIPKQFLEQYKNDFSNWKKF
ncbi:MAG: DUF2318 domain-containing protein [Clostridium sp.]|nr:DUF2318 domain-containing protein [Clostridium sp.]